MDQQDLRLQCLKMASELGGNTEAVISAAQRMLDFIAGSPQPRTHDSKATEPISAPAETASEPEPPAATSAEPLQAQEIADPIAACGTALVMPEGGELIDAVPNPEAGAAIAEAPEAAAGDDPLPVSAATETEVQEEVVATAAEPTEPLPEPQAAPASETEPNEPASGEEAEQVAEAAVDESNEPVKSEQEAHPAEPATETEVAAEPAAPAPEEATGHTIPGQHAVNGSSDTVAPA